VIDGAKSMSMTALDRWPTRPSSRGEGRFAATLECAERHRKVARGPVANHDSAAVLHEHLAADLRGHWLLAVRPAPSRRTGARRIDAHARNS